LRVIREGARHVAFSREGVRTVAKNDGIVEPKLQGAIKIVNGEVVVTPVVMSQSAVVEGQSQGRVEFDGLIEGIECLVIIPSARWRSPRW
jgi:hypothetical protein